MKYDIELTVTPKPGIRDPQGDAVQQGLEDAGYTQTTVRGVGRSLLLTVEADDESGARATVEHMCRDLLVNPNLESFSIRSCTRAGG